MERVITAKNFDLNAIHYANDAKPKRLESGASQLYLNYGPDRDPIIIQTPAFTLPFNMSSFDTGKDGYIKYSIEASFRGMEEYPSLKQFYNKFQELDNKFIDDGVANSLKWFKKKKLTREIIEEGTMYNRLIKPSIDKMTGEPDGKYPPTIRFKLPNRNDQFMFRTYDFSKNPLETPLKDLLVKGAKVRLLVQCTGLWIASGRYGVGFKVVQLRVKAPPRLMSYSFLSDSEDEGDDNTNDTNDTPEPSSNVVDDSDSDDSDESDSDNEPVAPVKIVKKKRGRRKKTN